MHEGINQRSFHTMSIPQPQTNPYPQAKPGAKHCRACGHARLEPFYRASNALGTPGVGLGLSMAKEFVELHRGTLELRSQLGVGTTATVRFPLVEPEAELMG
jgi:hypothetical protein